jgi:hypothetical protein
VASLRPIRTAHKTLGGHILEHPSCGGFMPTAETTLIPARPAFLNRSPAYADAREPLMAWYSQVKAADWATPAHVATASMRCLTAGDR